MKIRQRLTVSISSEGKQTMLEPDPPKETNPNKDPEPSQGREENPDPAARRPAAPREVGGRGGLDPTRFGDWEKNGRCIDF